MRLKSSAAVLAGAALLSPAAAGAQDTPGWAAEGYFGAVSDYRYRGVSLSGRDPAAQAELTVSSPSGVYAYGWASSIDYGDDLEVMGALGWSGEAGGVAFDAGAGVYSYPGLADSSLFEIYGAISRDVGAITLAGGAGYYPEQDNLGGGDNLYVHAGIIVPLSADGLTADLTIGWEDGAFGDDKLDWSAGVAAPLGPLELRAAYVGTNVDGADEAKDAVIAELRYRFAF